MKILRQNSGFALIFSLIFLSLIVSFMAVYILSVAHGLSEAGQTANQSKAYYVADAGLVDAYERIVQAGVTTFSASTPGNPFIPSATTDNGVYSVGSVNGSYTVTLAVTTSPRLTYTITSTGTYGKTTKTLQLQIISAAISKYAYWSNTEINPTLGTLWWITGQLTIGPVQTNGRLNISGNPVFDGAVTEANLPQPAMGATPNYYDGTAGNPNGNPSDPAYVFPDGLTNNAPAIDLPPPATIGSFYTTASNGGLILTGASTIIFNPTGTITVTGNVVNSSCTTTTAYHNTTISVPANKVVYVQSTKTIANCHSSATDGNATVQGTISGQLTVAADQNVYISGNVAYNSDPRVTPSSTDMVALVANNNVTVEEASAPAQLEIVGVLEALTGSFNVDQYSVNKDPIAGGYDGAVMDQFGSMINQYSGCTGVFNPSTNKLTAGWNQEQSYDSRLATTAPPGFPPYVNNSGYAVFNKLNISECVSGVCG